MMENKIYKQRNVHINKSMSVARNQGINSIIKFIPHRCDGL